MTPKPVKQWMTPNDCLGLTALSLVEVGLNIIADLTPKKSRRWNKIEAMREKLEDINLSFPGDLPEDWVQRNMPLHIAIEKEMNKLLRSYKASIARAEQRPVVGRGKDGRFCSLV